MSAMTGPRSPTSPWHQESQTLALPGPSSPATFFPLSDSRPSTFNRISPSQTLSSDSNYFSFNLESPSLLKNRDHLSRIHSNESPEGQFISGKEVAGEQHVPFGVRPGSEGNVPDSAVYRLSLNRAIGKGELNTSASKAVPSQSAQTTGATGRPVSVEHCAELLGSCAHDVMLLDVRPYAHFSRGSIRGALNLCIPTTLLKRPSFDTRKLANTFTNESDRVTFARWKNCRHIIVYDAATASMKDAGPLINVLKKFSAEGWTGDGQILMGGFRAFSAKFPELTQQQQQASGPQSKKTSLMHIDLPQSAPIAGGCNIPESSSAAIPFFGNIRQNMDLVGGVGQIALKHSEHLSESQRRSLPPWLCQVSDPSDQGRMAASRFLDIEKTELERMRQALSYNHDNISSSNRNSNETFRVAGIEKGTKNRYNDIYPYDHTRVRLHDIPSGGCDYVNASYMKAEHSDRYYIATQAPVPDTFNDFWRVVWEQDIRLVVSLTAEVERGQVKCHPYWKSGTYGPFHVNNFSKKYIPMEPADSPQANSRSPMDSEKSAIVVRHFGLSHSGYPFEPLREVTQLQYPDWPDFGTTSQPRHLLQLIEQCDKVRTATANAAPGNPKRPVLVHCSAGCGRTGTFCTVDSVLDVLQRQLTKEREGQSPEPWLGGGHLDLVAKTVSDFRTQRPSVVQNLSQFVLCYESVLEWAVEQTHNNPR
ncbi:Putative Tyrosine-protein phosphatase 1 [Aspergillus calidoustus]|uniref:protein-tyrosine-phosphatase n=1 Tax=Aspergillus calidoustus TaxID=454130 RepID=A0A0U5FT61_ASPCI|nr:Putative Tyrosine-protein phosphatase 1 [Aspergillus calidoustus]